MLAPLSHRIPTLLRFKKLSPQEGQRATRTYFLYALITSAIIHLLLLNIQFNLPKKSLPIARDKGVDIILLNHVQAAELNPNANLLAQSSQDGGGDTDLDKYTKSPLLASDQHSNGDALEQAQAKQASLEKQQQELLNQLKNPHQNTSSNTSDSKNRAETDHEQSQEAQLLARQYAAISARIDDYNKRPKRHFYAPSTSEYRFANYVDQWRQRVEAIGNKNYPKEARGKYYGSLRMTVYVRADGHIDKIELDKPAEHDILNQAARRIIQLAAPFPAFPDNIAKDTDTLVITRTWHFKNETLSVDNQN